MNVIEFNIKTTPHSKTGIKGILIDFGGSNARITFESLITQKSKLIYDLEPKGTINNPDNFIASFVQRIAPDEYNFVYTKNKKTKIIHSHEQNVKQTVDVYKIGNHCFTKETLNTLVPTFQGHEVSLSSFLKATTIQLPADGKYCSNTTINNILFHNCVPHDIDRKFIKVLNSSLSSIKNKIDGHCPIHISISKYTKKSFNVNSKEYFERKALTVHHGYLELEILNSHF